MKRRHLRPPTLALLLVVGLGLAGCAHAQDPAPVQPAQVQPAQIRLIPGSADLHRVTLTQEAVSDVGIRTAPVRAATTAKAGTPQGGARALTVTAATTARAGTPRGGARVLTVIPLTAVIYDPQGRSWTYVTPAPRTFVRQAITIDHMVGDQVYLRSGPAVGTPVVTVGAAELLGAEYGVGEE